MLRLRVHRSNARVVSLIMVLSAIAVPLVGDQAAAAGYTGVRVAGFEWPYDIEAGGGSVFVSDRLTGDVGVLSPEGTLLWTITGLTGTRDLQFRKGVLFVAEQGASRIARFDVTGDYPIPLRSIDTSSVTATPTNLRIADGDLWFTDCGEEQFSMGRVDLPSRTVSDQTPAWDDVPVTTGCNMLHANTNAPGTLILTHGYHAYRFDISSGSAVFITKDSWAPGVINVGLSALTPDGLSLVSASPGSLSTYSIDDFAGPDFTYVADTNPYNLGGAYATSTSGPGYLVSPSTGASTGVWIWKNGVKRNLRWWPLAVQESYLRVAIDETADRVFAVSWKSGRPMLFYSLKINTVPTSLSLTAKPRTVDFGTPTTLSATVEPPSKGRLIRFFMTDLDGKRRKVGEDRTNLAGIATIKYAPPEYATLQAVFPGDSGHEASTSNTQVVQVSNVVEGKLVKFYGTSGKYRLYREDQRVWYQVVVRPNHAGEEVGIELQAFTKNRIWRTLDYIYVKLSSTSRATAYVREGILRKSSYRLYAYVEPDGKRLLGAKAPYSYFKVTS